MRKRFRFGLRSLALLVAVVCVALWAVPAALEWGKWRLLQKVVNDTISEIAASPEKPTIYMGVAWHSTYVLANVEIKWNLSTNSGSPITSKPRSGAIFVEMPGKVHTWAQPSEVMQLIRQND
jgi:hypothetical protein